MFTQEEANNVTQATEAPNFRQVFGCELKIDMDPADITGPITGV